MESFTHELVVIIRGSDLITARRSFGKNEALNGLIENLLEHFPDLEDSSTLPAIRDKIRMKLVSLDRIYNKCGRKWELFEKRNPDYNDEEFEVAVEIRTNSDPNDEPGPSNCGRPTVNFRDLTQRQKRARLEKFKNVESHELLAATANSFRADGEKGAVSVLNMLENSPTVGRALSKSLSKKHQTLSGEKALAVMHDCGLTVNAYKKLRQVLINEECDILPSYYAVQKTKMDNASNK